MLAYIPNFSATTDIETKQAPSILVVDDDHNVGRMVQTVLLALAQDIVVVESGQDAIDTCRNRSFDLIITDLRMSGMNGFQLLRRVARDYSAMKRILVSGNPGLEQTMKSIDSEAVHRYLAKPWTHQKLLNAVTELWFS